MKTALALGTFDGLHDGHRAVLEAVLPYNSIAVSFRLPPKAVLSGAPKLLMTPADKLRSLKKLGIKNVELLDFEEVRSLEATEFLDMLVHRFSPKLISCGYNYRFGKNAAGDTRLLKEYCKEKGIDFVCHDCVCSADGTPISSTALRTMLKNGELQKANSHIYGGFSFSAPVLHGDERGRTIGFPTINQKYPDVLVPIKFGVYAVKVIIEDEEYNGIANIGVRPTWKTEHIMSETYIENFSGDLYERLVTVKPLAFLRGETVFSSVDELKSTIINDIDRMHNL